MIRKIILSMVFLSAISMFLIPAYVATAADVQPFFMVLPDRYHGIAVNVVLLGRYDPSSIKVVVEEIWPQYYYELEVGTGDGPGIIYPEPTWPSYGVEPNMICGVWVVVFLDNGYLVGHAVIEINDYGTVSLPVTADFILFS